MRVKDANYITGHRTGLGRTSKMPGYSTALSAFDCPTGSLLAKITGTVCNKCYAMKGNYLFPDVKASHKARLAAIIHPLWVDAMSFLIARRCTIGDPELSFFRWFDSGDLQTIDHLVKILEVARRTPGVHHWLATREVKLLKHYDKGVKAGLYPLPPGNVTFRVSASRFGQPPLTNLPTWANTATVDWEQAPHNCPAPKQNNSCGSCRACWDKSVPNVNYHQH